MKNRIAILLHRRNSSGAALFPPPECAEPAQNVLVGDRMKGDTATRAPEEVRRQRRSGLAGDFLASQADDVLGKDGADRGCEGTRPTAAIVCDLLPNAEFGHDVLRAEKGIALLGWSGTVDGSTRGEAVQRACWPQLAHRRADDPQSVDDARGQMARRNPA